MCRITESVSVVCDSEVLVMCVTLDGEITTRNITEWRKITEKGGKGRHRKIMPS